MSVVYNTESYKDVKNEMADLTQDHYTDGDPRNRYADLAIDWEAYEMLEDTGGALLITAREDGVLIGYLSMILTEHQHIKGFIVAAADALYIDKEHRGQSVATDMIKATEAALKEAGVDWLSLHFREDKTGFGLTDKLGYTKTEVVYSKSLGEK